VQPLAQRMKGCELSKFRNNIGVPAQVQVGVDAVFHRLQAHLLHARFLP
jgi:hypothetical protein